MTTMKEVRLLTKGNYDREPQGNNLFVVLQIYGGRRQYEVLAKNNDGEGRLDLFSGKKQRPWRFSGVLCVSAIIALGVLAFAVLWLAGKVDTQTAVVGAALISVFGVYTICELHPRFRRSNCIE